MIAPEDAIYQAGYDVVRTIRELALWEVPGRPYMPLPHDIAAERSVLEALVAGRRLPSSLACSAADHYLEAHRAVASVIEALEETGRLDGGAPPDHGLIVRVLAKQGASRERVAQLLVELLDDEPMRADVEQLAERVAELGARRRTIAAMQRIDALWRCDEAVPADAMSLLLLELERWQ